VAPKEVARLLCCPNGHRAATPEIKRVTIGNRSERYPLAELKRFLGVKC
jgi:hypothetical protein